MRLVVIEDDQSIRDLISLYLLDAADIAATFRTATEAQAWDGWDTVDLVVTDHMMPGLTGAGMCKWLAVEHPNVLRILTSAASPAPGDRRTAHLYIDKTDLVVGLTGLLTAVQRLTRGA